MWLLITLFAAFNFPVFGLDCLDWQGAVVKEGTRYMPDKKDPCQTCTCQEGFPVTCHSAQCSPPDCTLWQQVEGECCEFKCATLPDNEAGSRGNASFNPGNNNNSSHNVDTANLGIRLAASTVTSFLILALLLFMIHRLRQRRLLIMMRRMNGDNTSSDDDTAYMNGYVNFDAGIEFPPYTEPPPPYSPPKPPHITAGESPPPYTETENNNIPDNNNIEHQQNNYHISNETSDTPSASSNENNEQTVRRDDDTANLVSNHRNTLSRGSHDLVQSAPVQHVNEDNETLSSHCNSGNGTAVREENFRESAPSESCRTMRTNSMHSPDSSPTHVVVRTHKTMKSVPNSKNSAYYESVPVNSADAAGPQRSSKLQQQLQGRDSIQGSADSDYGTTSGSNNRNSATASRHSHTYSLNPRESNKDHRRSLLRSFQENDNPSANSMNAASCYAPVEASYMSRSNVDVAETTRKTAQSNQTSNEDYANNRRASAANVRSSETHDTNSARPSPAHANTTEASLEAPAYSASVHNTCTASESSPHNAGNAIINNDMQYPAVPVAPPPYNPYEGITSQSEAEDHNTTERDSIGNTFRNSNSGANISPVIVFDVNDNDTGSHSAVIARPDDNRPGSGNDLWPGRYSRGETDMQNHAQPKVHNRCGPNPKNIQSHGEGGNKRRHQRQRSAGVDANDNVTRNSVSVWPATNTECQVVPPSCAALDNTEHYRRALTRAETTADDAKYKQYGFIDCPDILAAKQFPHLDQNGHQDNSVETANQGKRQRSSSRERRERSSSREKKQRGVAQDTSLQCGNPSLGGASWRHRSSSGGRSRERGTNACKDGHHNTSERKRSRSRSGERAHRRPRSHERDNQTLGRCTDCEGVCRCRYTEDINRRQRHRSGSGERSTSSSDNNTSHMSRKQERNAELAQQRESRSLERKRKRQSLANRASAVYTANGNRVVFSGDAAQAKTLHNSRTDKEMVTPIH